MTTIDPRDLKGKDKLIYICEVMKMRARGRAEMEAAKRKRLQRAHKRAKTALGEGLGARTRKHMGLVDDALYGNYVRGWFYAE